MNHPTEPDLGHSPILSVDRFSPVLIGASSGPVDRVVCLRGAFLLDEGHGAVRSARARFTALGTIEVDINGAPVDDAVLTPGWSSYEWRVRYREVDVSDHLDEQNVCEIRLGPGWYAGRLGWGTWQHLYGDTPAAGLELRIAFDDGHVQTFGTGPDWTWAPSVTTYADLYNGQTIDASADIGGSWPVRSVAAPSVDFEPYIAPPVVRQEVVAPARVWRFTDGAFLADFGQNLVGWTRITVAGEAGAQIVVRHAEELEAGDLALRPLRSARAEDRFILSGADDVFEPTFTYHGFRYVKVTGWPGDEAAVTDGLRAVIIGSRIRRTGTLHTSNPLLNRFHENVVWSMRGNFVDIPTDCPQRDERLGWTGDIAVFAPTATFLFDVQDFLSDWLRDLELETRHANGVVPYVVPDPLKLTPGAVDDIVRHSPNPTAIWGDAAVWVPWALYQHDGDLARLRSHYSVMRLHTDAVLRVLDPDGVWRVGFQYGDWLDPAAPPEDPGAARAPKELVATAAFHRTLTIMAAASAALGESASAETYSREKTRVREGFRAQYVRAGHLTSESTTAYTLAIVFGLLDDGGEISQAGDRLATMVANDGYRIATGFAGTPFVADALTITGHAGDAYRLLLQTDRPSWLYPVTMGATTVWERWDSMLPDGSINPGEMTSFNHYALGSVADWMHRSIGGIAALEAGYGRVLIAPVPGQGVDSAQATLETRHGRIAVAWSAADDRFVIRATIPTEGLLRLPDGSEEIVAAGTHERAIAWAPA